MIFVTDKGRMCNNILQYGHVYAWAREHGRKSISMRFCYKYQYFKICHTKGHNFLSYVFAKYAAKWGLMPTVEFNDIAEEAIQRDASLIAKHKHVLVKGWCVRFYDLFIKHKAEIIDLFSFDAPILKKTRDFMGEKADDELRLGVHIRRGDYKTWHNGKYYFEDADYQNYILQFQSLFPNKKITAYICSNDPMLDKESYKKHLKGIRVVISQGGQEDDLCLLSECEYLIGAPSTFTLVAAMYHDLPLYWIEKKDEALSLNSFDKFNHLFQNIR
ncbi:MAG: glycosyltransferase [Prevotella sp.]|jgi:hypothetical protein|uniref:alpha-1,2-fucosyltransferase n=1 Tax=Prevotella sp. TaxID=59823 RepID=UPI000EEDA4C9|nr:glycosyltransferase [Prevotella sp.]HCD65586.1 glycosyltransferase [Prevotella sp.]